MFIQEYLFDPEAQAGLTVYLHEEKAEYERVGDRPFVMVIPGGGYSFCSEREAEPIALNFAAQGFHSGVLRYHVGTHRSFSHSLEDAEKAIAKIQELTSEWGIDSEKIAVIGFSAGGHLAAALSTLSPMKPSLCMLGYPAIVSSFAAVMKIDAPSLEKCVTKDTPPTFLFSTFEDNVVPIENSLAYLQALEEHEVPFESHIFQKGRHGLSLATERFGNRKEMVDLRFARWFDECVEWLELNWADKAAQPALFPDLGQWPIRALLESGENKRLLLQAFPSWADKSRLKIVKNISLQQLLTIMPEAFENVSYQKLVSQLIDPRKEE
ncbi:MAG: alpha/beta hydrolase [Enterococcus casseliflavus]|nr:alpha/beta hydrolase [Enterococcus casseliflavus]